MTNDKQRERLVELLGDYLYSEQIADHLLSKGIIVPPCKVGDVVYYISGKIVKEARIEEIYYCGDAFAYRVSHNYLYFDMQSDELYFTKEEAEKALKGVNEK